MRKISTNGINDIEIVDSIDDGYIDWGVNAINAPSVWHLTKGEGVKVAIIDTGIDTNHREFEGKIKGKFNMLGDKGTDVTDGYGHGTHVAGLIAGERTGVAPNAELYIAKVLNDRGYGSYANILDGISFAINNKVDILTMSLGMNDKLPLILEKKIRLAISRGITIVCATGNAGKKPIDYPARYDEVIAVGGLDRDLRRADFSNFELRKIDTSAPAVEILSTWKDNNYARLTGTSMASPLVAGGLALVKSYYRKKGVELSPQDMKQMLTNLGEYDRWHGYGLFDLTKLIN